MTASIPSSAISRSVVCRSSRRRAPRPRRVHVRRGGGLDGGGFGGHMYCTIVHKIVGAWRTTRAQGGRRRRHRRRHRRRRDHPGARPQGSRRRPRRARGRGGRDGLQQGRRADLLPRPVSRRVLSRAGPASARALARDRVAGGAGAARPHRRADHGPVRRACGRRSTAAEQPAELLDADDARRRFGVDTDGRTALHQPEAGSSTPPAPTRRCSGWPPRPAPRCTTARPWSRSSRMRRA